MNSFEAVQKVVKTYFEASYYQKVDELRPAFHPDARIAGMIGDKYIDLSVDDFMERVRNQGQDYPLDKTIRTISIVGDIAYADVRVLVGKTWFTDFLSLLKVDGQWVIRHKAFTAEVG
jgi:hypothetical protein